MFYRLGSLYVLRGWSKMSRALVKRPGNQVWPLTQEEFQALVLCDGETEIVDEKFDSTIIHIIKNYVENKVVEICQYPCPIDSDQAYWYFDNRFVQRVIWSITGKCNFSCRHCYMDAPEGVLGELSTKEALNLIDQMAECGVMRIDITGGEPLIRHDFWQLIDRILFYKIDIGKIYTNGWFINENVLDQFESRGIKPHISVSFDGIGWHDWMRGIKGAEEKTLNALKLCKKRGFNTSVEMCAHKGNVDSLPETVQVLNEVGVDILKLANVTKTELWRCHSEGNVLSIQEYTDAMNRYIPKYYEAGCPIGTLILSGVIALYRDKPYEIIMNRYDGTEKCLDSHLCGMARWACYITPEGRLLPCLPMTSSSEQRRFPKIQEIGLKQGLNDSFYMRFIDGRVRDLLKINAECAACVYRYKCGGGCRANALLDGNHDLMGCDRMMCMLWKSGYEETILQTAECAIKKCRKNNFGSANLIKNS